MTISYANFALVVAQTTDIPIGRYIKRPRAPLLSLFYIRDDDLPEA